MLNLRSVGAIVLLTAGLVMAACVSTQTQQSPGEYVDDSVLTTKVKAALFDDPGTKAICGRPARPSAAAQDPKVEASFSVFARTWLEKLRTAGAANDAQRGRRQIRAEFETELRQTQSTRVPWVGILRYCEETLRCTVASTASCQVSKTTAVAEIFPFQAGQWSY
jgi:hypothetical protein